MGWDGSWVGGVGVVGSEKGCGEVKGGVGLGEMGPEGLRSERRGEERRGF